MLEVSQLVALVVFVATVIVVISGVVDRALAAMAGVALMVLLGVLEPSDVVRYIDWNILALLVGIWLIAGYFTDSGVPEYIAFRMLRRSGGDLAKLMIMMASFAALISMFVDNVVVVLMMAPMIFSMCRSLKVDPSPFVIFTALSANFSGTALLIGDLPPMMLASVAGIGFMDFFISQGRPAAFPILMLTLILLMIIYWAYFKRQSWRLDNSWRLNKMPHIKNERLAILSTLFFAGTVAALAMHEVLGLPLGLIGFCGAIVLALAVKEGFEERLSEIDWRAVFFYAALFALVGGLKKVGLIGMLAGWVASLIGSSRLLGVSVIYWVSAGLVSVVEHDAYILVMLNTIKELSILYGIDPYPLWWSLVLSGTLGSNFTMMGAPALLVALNICEREGYKVNLKDFFKMTVPFSAASLIICFAITVAFWAL